MTDVSSQVAAAHLELIEAVGAALAATAADTPARTAALYQIDRYRQDGWHALADALGARLAGEEAGRGGQLDESRLDEEDRMILAAAVRAARDPGWLSQVAEQAEAQAAEQIAALILAATWGEREALAALNEMREVARAAGMEGSTAHAFVAMVEGERNADALLATHVNAQAGLTQRTLAALDRLEREAD
ncbi:hypothetical protein GM160_05745 [Guyparkeria halophila]|uniref:Uncharacterized protein n=1 Tax=Guyparkeria halophila TaxID=47960 RepID=A0A6I6D502_9GAMM|nr:hypothetical protein [Guyparkeria halophila]QGT78441.1 hypothetical protein GM160_05745 [Guyparkeria halophila]